MRRMTAALLASTMMLASVGAAAQPTATSFTDMDGAIVKVPPSDLARLPLTDLVGESFQPVPQGTVLPEDYQGAPVVDRLGALVGRAIVVVSATNGELRRIVMDADVLLGYGGEVVELSAAEIRPVRTSDGTLLIQADATQDELFVRATAPASGSTVQPTGTTVQPTADPLTPTPVQ